MENKDNKIINTYKKCNSINKTSRITKYSDQYVRYVLYKNNLINSKTSKELLDEKYELAKNMYLNGISIKNICKELKIGTRNLSNRFKLEGIEIRGKSSTTTIVSKDKIKKILALYEDGNSIRTISKIINIERHTVSRILKENNYSIDNKKYHSKEDIFKKIDSEEKAYWLGFLYADGYISKLSSSVVLMIQNRDKEHLEKFKLFCKSDHPIVYSEYVRESGYVVRANKISINSRKMHDDLIDKGCFQVKSLILKFPTENQVPKNLIHHFIRGYLDGDGCIGIDNNNIFFSIVGTEDFLNGLQKIFKTNNKLYSSGKAFVYRVKGNKKALKILDYLYKDATIYLNRKYEKYIKHKEHLLSRPKTKSTEVLGELERN